ncbi:hypothetical protein EST62_10195 [Chlorobaculum sp. 24CR]|uniref:hypothetical protein n=1 Tax=Chlorobaculum sp. 24CR TaxID=2508878 RepID=UPI00100B49E5|nr:hypothetical protein [Chlorobaculum sp. 24CR]RXK82737.1 hypothetical protein EST62_10195 [Chlorobaculum sp. 24CR]
MNDFNLHRRQLIKNDQIEIVNNYSVLHFDDFPILYIGTNKYGNKIIGSHLEEDDDTKMILTLHTILTNKEFHQFLNGKISYLEILKNSTSISIVEKDYKFKILKAYDIDFDSLPNEYLPTSESYCPATVKSHSLTFSISLQGKLADLNKAIADEVSKIQNGFTEFLEDRIKSLKGFDLVPKALLQPYAEGSFKINFELDLSQKSKKGGNLFLSQAPIDKYIANYINYISENFTEDKDIFTSKNEDFSDKLKELEATLSDVYEKAFITKPNNINSFIKEDLIKSAGKFEKITEQVGKHFESASILGITETAETSLGFIDIDYCNKFQTIVEDIEVSKKGMTIDSEFKEYKIYIYHLNTDTRTGNAFIRNLDNEEEMSKPKIKINGDDGLEQTKYTESLYLNKWISVKAKAKKIGEKFKYLDIDYDN